MGQMPKELLEFFKRKQAKEAMYGAKLAAQGMRVLKHGGKYYNESGKNGSEDNGPGDPPTINDIANIRLLQGADGSPGSNQFFLKQGDDQYAPIGNLKALRQQLGEDRYGEYLSGLGMEVSRDKEGNITGFSPMVEATDVLRAKGFGGLSGEYGALDPYQRASKAFVDEYFGKSIGRGRNEAGMEGFGDKVYDRDETQKAHHANFVQSIADAQGPFVGLMDEYIQKYGEERGPGMFVNQMDTKTKVPKQAAFMMNQLLGGQGGGQGGM